MFEAKKCPHQHLLENNILLMLAALLKYNGDGCFSEIYAVENYAMLPEINLKSIYFQKQWT